jgi:hypothetical protein
VAPLVRLACTERNGCACSENGLWLPSKVARPRLSSAKKPGAGLTLRVTSDRARFTTTTDPSSSGPDRLDRRNGSPLAITTLKEKEFCRKKVSGVLTAPFSEVRDRRV